MTNIIPIGTDKILCPYVFSLQNKCKHEVKYTCEERDKKGRGGEGGRVGGGRGRGGGGT